MTAPELYRDPVYDGATDPLVVVQGDRWWMFYTQRRATHPRPGPGVAWVHGSRIGVAHSLNGRSWRYAGTLAPDGAGLHLVPGSPPDDVATTHWAPEVVFDGVGWRMYLTEIDGVPDRWPGHARRLVEYASDDLRTWRRRGPVEAAGDRAIDAAVARCPDGRWRLWYKDEAAGSVTAVAVSDDLDGWRADGVALGGRPHEGPTVFESAGWWWLLVDEWRGMAVHRSRDARRWERQGGPDAVVLGPGAVSGAGYGHHGAVLSHGEARHLYFFSHPARQSVREPVPDDAAARRSAIHRVALRVRDGLLVVE